MGRGQVLQESITWRRAPGLAGFEILNAVHTGRNWRMYNTTFGLAVPSTWDGEADYRHRRHRAVPGTVFCSEPGEVHTTPIVRNPGSFRAFTFTAATLLDYLVDRDVRVRDLQWGNGVQALSSRLGRKLEALNRACDPSVSQMEMQACLVEVVEVLMTQVMRIAAPMSSGAGESAQVAERARECIHYERDPQLDLVRLSERMGTSRFKVLRAFKRRYGLPPHAYQLCRRIARARELLMEGESPSVVAAECGFVDQSHFTRHFRRVVGVTPGIYARSK